MGCQGSKQTPQMKYQKSTLGAPLLKRIYSRMDKSAFVYLIRLKGLSGLVSPKGNLSGTADAFVELKMTPDDPTAGNQLQRSSNKPNTLSPVWVPAERFQFICTNKDQSKIILSVYSFHNTLGRVVMGDAFLSIKEVSLTLQGKMGDSSRSEDKTLKMYDGAGKNCGSVDFSIELMTAEEAVSCQEHSAYEYQRWQPVVLWGSLRPGHLLPTDPGKWSNDNSSKFGDALNEVAPPVPASWTIVKNWYIIATEQDPDGWTYGPDMRTNQWFPSATPTLVVRRRLWNREIVGALDRQSLQIVSNTNPIQDNEKSLSIVSRTSTISSVSRASSATSST